MWGGVTITEKKKFLPTIVSFVLIEKNVVYKMIKLQPVLKDYLWAEKS